MSRNKYTFLERATDAMAKWGGSWSFIIWFTVVNASHILFNIYSIHAFDKFPFIFLNLGLSMFSCYQAPIILMAANRQAQLDRRRDDDDYRLDKDTNKRIKHIEEILKTKFHE